MLKRKIDSFIKEFFRRSKNALLITGARQIGKTFSVREFGKKFESFIEINFVENQSAVEIFKTAKNSADILLRLSAMTNIPLIKGKTLIFFDEVQKCPEIVTAIKFLVEEGSYRYILSGSLLGVELLDLRSVPVGYLEVKDMYPLDFEEFIICNNVNKAIISHVKDAFYEKRPVDNVIHVKLLELFRLYLIVGGMPAAVSKYLETNNLQEVLAVQQEIIRLYKWDISQYAYKNKLKIEEIFDLIPSELNAKNKRFILKSLNRNAKFAYYEDSFLWLKNAGVALPVYNVEEPKVPLLLAKSRNLFKLFQSDVGLLAAQYSDGIQLKIIMGQSDINFGAIYENAVAQELAAHDFNLYYFNSKKQGELDFVVEKDGMILPIEVKSGKDYAVHRALTNILENSEYNIKEALVLSNANIKQVGKILYAPIYMVMLIEKKKEKPLIYKIDLSAVS
ncbi:AAA family ATPase [Succinatimonas hippei]|uniref:ATP-binding protein n=1 Tax=Succinatimonas hippei TaxID=626938 RepID=UPI0025A4337C|nr:AAA family ATPase [Succinatimonas hippei]MDM8119729.1 AAA family ATPase [Succinatimonas hippei]